MKTVFVVTGRWPYELSKIYAIFSKEEKAKEWINDTKNKPDWMNSTDSMSHFFKIEPHDFIE